MTADTVYSDSTLEKNIRADLKSSSLRLVNKNDIVIIDGSWVREN